MTDREKLIELIKQKERCLCDMCVPGNERERNAIKLADHLIANGVTVGDTKSATTTEHDKAFASGFQEGMDHARSWMGGPGCDACPTREAYAKAARERDDYKKELEERKQEVQK